MSDRVDVTRLVKVTYVTRPLYQGTATYDGSWWSIHFTKLPDNGRVHTQGKTWIEAIDMSRDAIALYLGVEEGSFDVYLQLADEQLNSLVTEAHNSVAEAERSKKESIDALTYAAKSLRPHHTLRDIGAILNISHQYVDHLSKK